MRATHSIFPLRAYTDPSAASGAPRSTLRIQDGSSSSASITDVDMLTERAIPLVDSPLFVCTPASRRTSSTAHTSHFSSSSPSSFAHSSASLHATATLRRRSSLVSVYVVQSLLLLSTPGELDDTELEISPLFHTFCSTSFARRSGETCAKTAAIPDSLRYGSEPITDNGSARAVWNALYA